MFNGNNQIKQHELISLGRNNNSGPLSNIGSGLMDLSNKNKYHSRTYTQKDLSNTSNHMLTIPGSLPKLNVPQRNFKRGSVYENNLQEGYTQSKAPIVNLDRHLEEKCTFFS